MGNKHSAQELDTLTAIMRSEDGETQLRALFAEVDKDKNGTLDKEEWTAFGNVLFVGMVKTPNKEVEAEVAAKFKDDAPAMKNMVAKMTMSAVHMIANENSPHHKRDIAAWVDEMFRVCDTNADGVVSWDEFRKFILDYGVAQVAERKQELRDRVADNIEANRGGLYVHHQSGGSSSTVTIQGHVDPNAVRRGE